VGTIQTLLKIKADATDAVRGLKPLQTSLDEVAKDAQVAETALDGLDGQHKISLNDQAIESARKEITRLRDSMRAQLRMDPTVDTREAQKRIKQLQSSIKTLDREEISIDAKLDVDTSALSALHTTVVAVRGDLIGSAAGGGAAGGLVGGLSAASRGLQGVGGAAGAAAGPIAGAGVAMVLAGGAAWTLGQNAADAETQIAQLDALTKGMGEETFAALQTWAKDTPFEMGEATEATKKLAAAGVELKAIPDYLNDIGEVASATGVPLSQVATVFAQMESKGKATFEEMQQLAEAGIPVWQVLSEKLGLTTAEVQKLASEGKLGADAIDLLRESLGESFTGSMARQADTFNGKMSTLRDTIDQTGQELGKVFLPSMKDLLTVATALAEPLLDAASAVAEFNAAMEENTGKGLVEGLVPAVGALGFLADHLGDGESAFDDAGDASDGFVDKVLTGLNSVEDEAEDAADAAKEVQEAWEDALDAFRNIGVNVRLKVDFLISQDDFEDSIHEALAGTEDEAGVVLPATLDIKSLEGLDDKQTEVVSSVSGWIEAGLEEGARRAEINPDFNREAWLKNHVYEGAKQLLIEAGVDPEKVGKTLRVVFGLQRPIRVDVVPHIKNIKPKIPPKMLDAMDASGHFVVTPEVQAPTVGKNGEPLAQLTTPMVTEITPEVVDSQAAQDALDNVANPGGKPRIARIEPLVDRSAAQAAKAALAELVRDLESQIHVDVEVPPGGKPKPPPGEVSDRNRRRLSAAGLTVGPEPGGSNTVTLARETERLAPRQDVVKVYVDGKEVASAIQVRSQGRAARGGRRVA
jgi:tape measure domain-containing protein